VSRGPSATARPAVRAGPPLRLVREARLPDLLREVAPDLHRLEASGVARRDGLLWIVCDNLPHLIGLDPQLRPGRGAVRLVRRPGRAPGYEDLAWDPESGRWLVLVEGAPTAEGFQPRLDEFDAGGRLLGRRWVTLAVESPNKGLEGLTTVRRGGRSWLVALSEGNGNHAGRRGRRPGHGLLHVLDLQGDEWAVTATVRLPAGLSFTDYSAVSARGDTLAVASQESSALWIGQLRPDRWEVAGGGRVHPFPRDRRGRVRYGTVEGVCWLDDRTLAVVSDRPKRRQARRLRAQGESVHIFEVPRHPQEPAARQTRG